MAERERRRRSRRDGGRMFRVLSSQGKDEDWIAELREEFPDDVRAGRFPADDGASLYDARADDDVPAAGARATTSDGRPPGPAPPGAAGPRRATDGADAVGPPAVVDPPAVVEVPAAVEPPAVVGPPAAVEPPAVVEPAARRRTVTSGPPVSAEPPASGAPAAGGEGAAVDPVPSAADDPWQLFADVLDAQQSTLVALAERLDQVEARLDQASRRLPATAPRRAAGPRPDGPTMREVVDALRASALGSAARLGREVARRRR